MPETDSPRTVEKTEGPHVQQFSIFLRNKVGALLDVVKMLNEHAVDVLALNVQDSADAAIVRIVVSDPDAVQDLFASHEIPCSTCDLVVAELKEGASGLGKLLTGGATRVPEWYDLLFWSFVTFSNLNPRPANGNAGAGAEVDA